MVPIRTVLCPVDFSPLSDRVLQIAVAVCSKLEAKLVLHHNTGPAPPGFLGVGWMWSEEKRQEQQRKAEQIPEELTRYFALMPEGVEYEAKVTHGPLEVAVTYLAKELPAGLIVMGSHGPSSAGHESLTEQIVTRSPCTVLTVGEKCEPEAYLTPRNIPPDHLPVVVPVDFTERSRLALEFAFQLADEMPHHLHLVHVLRADEEKSDNALGRAEERVLGAVPEALRDRTSVWVSPGKPSEEILKAARAQEALFIVMGAHRKSAFKRRLFGTTTYDVLHGAECPVWFVPEGTVQ